MSATTESPMSNVTARPWQMIAAASIGNALEWFDLAIYGFFAVTISKLFFPAGNEAVSLFLTLGTFGVTFFMRPLGAIVLGAYADRVGRKAALTLSIRLMMLGTLITAILPTYRTIGVAAPVLLVGARLIQGFSAGGEFGSATAFLAEQVPARRGFYASWQTASQGLTTLLAAIFGLVLTGSLSAAQLESWGWRVPFVFGLVIGPVAWYIRTRLDEPAEFRAARTVATPLKTTFAQQKQRVVVAIGTVVLGTVSTYVVLFMPTYGVRELGLPQSVTFGAVAITGLVQCVLAPFAGHLSDRAGRLPVMLVPAVLLMLSIYPAFHLLIANTTIATLMMVQILLGVLTTGYFGALPGLLSELFPVHVRTTGMSIAYNFSVVVFGGFAPFVIAFAIRVTGNKAAPAFYLIGAAMISIVALLIARRRFAVR